MEPVSATIRITADPARVWAVVTDVEGAPRRIRDIEATERVDPGALRVGSSWRETRRLLGRATTFEVTVTALEPTTFLDVEGSAAGAHYRSGFRLHPRGGQVTDLEAYFEASATNGVARWLQRTAGRRLHRRITATLQREVEDIRAALVEENNGATPPGGVRARGHTIGSGR